MLGVTAPDRFPLVRGLQLCSREITQRLGHRESSRLVRALVAADERKLEQSLQRVEHQHGLVPIGHRAYRLDRVDPSWAGEHAEPAEEPALARRQQPVGPFKGCAQAPLALGRIARDAAQHVG